MDELGNKEDTETVDAIINKIGKTPNFQMLVVATCAMSFAYVGSIFTYMVQFTGFIPNEEFTCLSQKCSDVRSTFTLESGKREYAFITGYIKRGTQRHTLYKQITLKAVNMNTG
jgi:hypothetical protein